MLYGHKGTLDDFNGNDSGFGSPGDAWSDLNGFTLRNLPIAPWQFDPGKLAVNTPAVGPAEPPEAQTILFSPDKPIAGAAKAGTSGTIATTSTGSATATGTTASSASPFIINISWDSSVSSAPTGFTTAVTNAVQYLEAQFRDPVTINIDVGYGEVGGSALGTGALGSSEWYLNSVGYSQLVSALSADATTSADASAVASLPTTSPVNGTFWTTTAQAKALGLASPTNPAVDGYVGFSSSLPFTYADTNGVASGTYDFNAVALHEISEVMGRALLTGGTIGSTQGSYSLYDLFHYSAPGVRDFSGSTAGYFSADSGATDLAAFNTVAGGDAGDWSSSVSNDAFDAFSNPGVVNAVSSADLTALDVIGWNPASGTSSTTSPVPASTPTGIAVAPATGSLAGLQSSGGLAANRAIGTVRQAGGPSGDQYSFSLAGTGASTFTLAAANNAAKLYAGSSGVGGAVNGKLYALTITAVDTTAGTSSQAMPVDVVVGSSSNDTVQLASLVGSAAAATPTFIYGLGGADHINATGMTGKLWLAGGAGADVMTGGTGVNDYLYGRVSDSTASAMDLITNFHAASDLIDLTGLGTTLGYAGQLNTPALGADSIGWQQSGGNTYVYVNATGSSQNLSATSMKIELQGLVTPGAGNFLHH